jgi:hypothetical protein
MFLHNKNKAATLVEVVVYTGVLSIIIIAVFNAIHYSYKSHSFVLDQIDATREARYGLERLVKDIREAAYADNGAYPVVSMSDNEFIFYSDVDNDNKVERIRYFIEDNKLKRGITDSSGVPPDYDTNNEELEIVSLNLRNIQEGIALFTYYNKSGTQLQDLDKLLDLKFVIIRLVTDINPGRLPNSYEFRSSATLRNLVNAYVE